MRLAMQSITNILRQSDHLLLLQSAPNQLNAHVGAIVDLGVICMVVSSVVHQNYISSGDLQVSCVS